MAKSYKIRKVKRARLKGDRWEIDFGMINGKRVRAYKRSKTDAEKYAQEKEQKLIHHGVSSLSVSEEDRVLFQAAKLRLGSVPIATAVDFYLEHHKPLREDLSLSALLEKAMIEKELAGMRKHSLSQFGCSCRSFVRGREDLPARLVTREEVKSWIHGNAWAAKTQKVYLGDLRALFGWAVQERYLRKNPLAGKEGFITLLQEEEKEIAVFDPSSCAALLRTALMGTSRDHSRDSAGRWSAGEVPGGFRPLIGYLAVALFAGVRPEEVKRTDTERLDVHGGTLVVTGAAAKRVKRKGRQRRVIELERTARIWLRLWQRLCPGADLVPKNFTRKWKELRAAAGIEAWPHDVLRHTFASYHYALHANRSRLQAMMGHTEDEDTLDRHYRAVMTLQKKVVSKRLAEEFWGLTPRRVRMGTLRNRF